MFFRKLLAASIVIAMGLAANWTWAGELSADLAAYLARVANEEKIRVVIRPVGAVDGLTLKRELATTYTRRADRHREALMTLQAAAERSQADLLPVLNRLRLENKAENVKTYWIDNLISVDMTPAAIEEFAARDDIEKIYPFPQVTMVEPLGEGGLAKPGATRAEIGLRAIGADVMWAMGYTGKGALIASIDTGIDGDHPALSAKWRGNNGYSAAESWFDPVGGESTPHTFGDPNGTVNEVNRYFHGTLIAGVLAGHQPSTGDTTGVAFDAQWISAAVMDVPGADIFEGLQWLIDPDGDPNTEEDVPDVINNSWGYITIPDWVPQVDCDDLFWNTIDNLEAAGAVTVWAAGNEGYLGNQDTPQSIRNPANRITSEVNTFAVGMIDAEFFPDSLFFVLNSSRGPSDCDGQTPKPEVAAPGYKIRSTTPGGTYSQPIYFGTSFSTPYVAGAVALLREYNPNATADTIKKALLHSAWDLPPTGDDNNTGMGLINIPAALALMPANTEPHLYIKENSYVRPAPGGSAEITITVRNSGTAVANVTLELVSLDSRLTVTSGSFFFGDFSAGAEKDNSAGPLTVTVAADVLVGERLPVEWRFSGNAYARTTKGTIAVGQARELDLFTHNIGNVIFSISSFGEYGLGDSALVWRSGADGFFHPKTSAQKTLFEMSFLVGTDADHVSDAARQMGDVPDNDFLVDASGQIRVEEPGDQADQQTFAAFSDAYAENPLGLFIEQRTFAFADATDDDYVIMEYVIHNRSDSPIAGMRAALFADWDFPWGDNQAGFDFAGFDSAAGVGWMQHKVAANRLFRGIAALTPEGMISYRYIKNDPVIYDGFTEEDKWRFMTSDFDTVSTIFTADASHMMTIGPFDLQPGDSAVAAFAVIGAETDGDMLDFARRARKKYGCLRGFISDLAAEPTALDFMVASDGGLPEPRDLSITNFCGDSQWKIEHSASWLAVDPDSGATPATVQVSVTDVSFPVGVYYDTLRIISPNAVGLPLVPVTLEIGEGQATLRVEPDSLYFTSTRHAAPPEAETVWIINDGFSDLEWTAANQAGWLAFTPVSGSIPVGDSVEVSVEVDTTGLDLGEHRDTIVITAPEAAGSPQQVPVLFDLEQGKSRLRVEPSWLFLSATQYGPPPAPKEIWIYNDGFSDMEWTAVKDSAWLVINPETGVVVPGGSTQISVGIDTTGILPDAELRDTIFVEATSADDSLWHVAVTFRLLFSVSTAFNAPNPFNPYLEDTEINLGMTDQAEAEIRIYDLTGELVRSLWAGPVSGGQVVVWDGRADDGPEVADGVYLCHIKTVAPNGSVREQVVKIAVLKE